MEKSFERLQRELSFEFSRYVLANPEFADKIPLGAQIVFLIEDNPEFNSWSRKVNESQREPGQPVVYIKIEGLAPAQVSRLINPHLELSTK